MSSLFDGRVQHLPLPLFTQPTGPDAPVLKRLLLPQGELAQFHDSDEAMRYMALIELKAGGVRGNHYHRHKKEFIYVLSGGFDLTVVEVENPSKPATFAVNAGERVIIEPGIAHALRTRVAGFAVEYSPVRFEPSDTIRHALAS